MKSVSENTLLLTSLQYTPNPAARSSLYLSSYRLSPVGPAHYIFFANTLYLFGDYLSPPCQLYWEQREERSYHESVEDGLSSLEVGNILLPPDK
jgi:hypothetical protein